MSRVEPNRNVYVGHRYVPKIFGEWDKQNEYEGLSIVTYQGASYTSKKRVPVGIDIKNEEFWILTGNYNAQVEYYRDETERVSNELELKASQSELDNFKNTTNENIDETNKRIEKISINLENFGDLNALDHTTIFKNAFEYAFNNDYVLEIPDNGQPYLINSNEVWDIPSIKSPGSILNIKGNLKFTHGYNFNIENVIFNIENDGYDSDFTFDDEYLITRKHPTNNINIENVEINGLTINGNRLRGFIKSDNVIQNVNIKNVNSLNIATCIAIGGKPKNILVDNVNGVNCENLIWLENFYKADVNNVNIKNTKTQSKWWLGKNNGVGSNGKDTILTESGDEITLNNIGGEWVIERPIYCQSKIVQADNLYSLNTGCFKFVGKENERVKSVNIGKTLIIRTDNDVLDNMGQIYWTDQYYLDNLTVICDENVNIEPFRIYNENNEIIINNIYRYGGIGTLFQTSGTSKLVTKKVMINNVYCELSGVINTNEIFIGNHPNSISYIDELIVNNLKVKINNPESIYRFIANEDSYNNAVFDKISVEGLNPQEGKYILGFETLDKTIVKNAEIKTNKIVNFYKGFNIHDKVVKTSNPLNMKIINKGADDESNLELLFNKKENVNNGNNNLSKIKLNRSRGYNSFYEYPTNINDNWLFKIKNKNGYAEILVFNGVITEKFNIGENIVIGDVSGIPQPDQIMIKPSENGLIEIRNRNEQPIPYEVSIEKIE